MQNLMWNLNPLRKVQRNWCTLLHKCSSVISLIQFLQSFYTAPLHSNCIQWEKSIFVAVQEDQIQTTVCLVLYKWAVHTTVCVPPPYKYNCMHSSFVQYQTYSCVWSSWGVKNHATSSLFSLFFQHKIYNFFLQKRIKQKLYFYFRFSLYILTLHFHFSFSL